MLKLHFALSLEHLADKMIEEVKKAWKNPFDAPIVIFPDPKLEQWFKLRWVQKNGVLANLNKKTIDGFLFEILVGDDKTKKKMTVDMLRNVIIAYLTQKEGDHFIYETLDNSIKAYLETVDNQGNKQLDDNKLFDFANIMSGLFLEYETSRPGKFFIDSDTGKLGKGILDCWKQGDSKDFFIQKNGTPNEKESWQRKLYSALFHNNGRDSLLTQIFKKIGGDINYLTLPFLYEDCKKNGKVEFKYNSKAPVFVIGLGGMGQFYRVILQEFAKQHEMYAYIQNPCMEFWEDCSGFPFSKDQLLMKIPSIQTDADDETEILDDNENDLLRYWGRAGRDNIKLWSQAANYDFDFKGCYNKDEKSIIPTDTLLHNIQWAIANRKNNLPNAKCRIPNDDGQYFANDNSFSVIAAPSKIREVEALHSHVCKLLNGSATCDGKPAKISDILVVSPNIDDYRTAIYQVFDQSTTAAEEQKKSNAKDRTLHIPFSIVDSVAKESLTANAIKALFNIKENQSISRPSFFALVRNPVVQFARGIHPDEVGDWESWISEMNVYRERLQNGNKVDDWTSGVKRLLIARFSRDLVNDNEAEIVPYEDFNSSNDNSLYRFIDCIESLEAWIHYKNIDSQKTGISENDLDFVTDFLNMWLFVQNPPKGFGGESIIYQNVVKAKENLKFLFATGTNSISWQLLFQTLLTAAQGSEYSCGNLFVNGLTFMKFAPNRTIPVKYIFMLGLDAKSFPGSQYSNTLDLRKSVRPWPGDDSPINKNRYAFLCQLMNTSDGFFVSYVNKDLQKDEDIYPSSLINDVRSFLAKSISANSTDHDKIWPAIKIDLDESRPWDDLFTEREIRNKYIKLQFNTKNFSDADKVEFVKKAKDNTLSYPKGVSFYQLKSFLNDPFQFQANLSLDIDEDGEDPEKIEFEPINLEFLKKFQLRKQFCGLSLGIPLNDEITSPEDLEKYIKGQGILPSGIFGDTEMQSITSNNEEIKNRILEKFPPESYDYCQESITLPLVNEINLKGKTPEMISWVLNGTIKICARAKNGSSIHIIDLVYSDIKKNHYLPSYISALAFIGSCNTHVPEVYIDLFSFKPGNKGKSLQIFKDREQAKDLLQKIYHKAFVEKFNRVTPACILSEANTYWEYISLIKETGNNSQDSKPWEYFAGKKLFDVERVCGYNPQNFKNMWKEDIKCMLEHMPDLKVPLGFPENDCVKSDEAEND